MRFFLELRDQSPKWLRASANKAKYVGPRLVFELGLPHQHQVIDPIQTLLLTGRGRDARTVVVGGRFAMEDRVIPGIDEAEITRAAQAQFDRLVARYPDRTWRHPPVDAIFRPSYPRAAAARDG